ncbi:MAG: endonuclease/exonuclease/phosphatase family protein [Terriglobales bacterium]
MSKIKVGTFNVENLFLRYKLMKFERGSIGKPKPVSMDKFKVRGHINMLGWELDDFGPISKSVRRLTAKVVLESDADVLALQEVENLEALIQFNRKYLKNAYPYMMVVDGNDPRQIDVGVLSRFDLRGVRTHRFEPVPSPPNQRIFSRDCLEVELELPGNSSLTVLVNHFKSKIGGGAEKRKRQATRVSKILEERFGKQLKGNFVVAGDLNAGNSEAELRPILQSLENVVERLPKADQWTHYYKKTKAAEQLDYLLLSPALAKKNPHALPQIERRGLGNDIDYYSGPRFNASISGSEGASDHCPVFIELNV